MSKLEKALIEAALAWWDTKCPTAFTDADHLANPTVNCQTEQEEELALTCAAYLKDKK